MSWLVRSETEASPVDQYEKKGSLQVNHVLNQANISGVGH